MDIIKFPKSGKKPFEVTKLEKDKLMTSSSMTFSCDCGNKMEITTSHMLFKNMEFYCPNCGTAYRINNPAFKQPPKPPIK
jgi:predicted RNA-binding Zn-ribbon protein involved in translation (DUF1610 family)